ncbi:MAG TPA: heavy-metal-associated domain-containing protein [Gemmatimonadaceae bacterium]|nr:heavy-metal-associated domain-containing protein [Gemmatimonadaceae bacterium]
MSKSWVRRLARRTTIPCCVRITTTVTIQGMLAVHAAHAVYTALAGVDGVITADVKVGRATIEHDGRATHEHIVDAIVAAGYVVTDIRDERRLPLL